MEKTQKGALQFDLAFSKDGGFCEIFHECTAALPACWAKTDPQPKHCYISSSDCPAVTIFCTYKLSMKVNDKHWFNDALPLHYLIVCVWWGLSGIWKF